MSPEITVALIAFGGVIVTALASVLVTLRSLRADLRKLDVQVQVNYAGPLLERRHAAYPRLYRLLGDFVKELRFGKVTRNYLVSLRDSLEEWDSANAVLVESRTQRMLYDFRKRLITELLPADETVFSSREFRDALRYEIGELETALRGELGVYVVEFTDSTKKAIAFETIRNRTEP